MGFEEQLAEFRKRLKDARDAKNLTGSQLGNAVGASKTAVSNWETGRYQPSVEQLMAICDELEVSADWLLVLNKLELSAEALREAREFEKLSPEARRKWRALRQTMFSEA